MAVSIGLLAHVADASNLEGTRRLHVFEFKVHSVAKGFGERIRWQRRGEDVQRRVVKRHVAESAENAADATSEFSGRSALCLEVMTTPTSRRFQNVRRALMVSGISYGGCRFEFERVRKVSM